MRKYEIMYILNSEDPNLKSLQEKLHLVLTNNGGKIEEFGDWGIKSLSYPIRKHKKGYYSVLIVKTANDNIEEFRRIARIEHNVLRILIINTEKEKHYQQSIVYAKTEIKNEKVERNNRNSRFERRENYNIDSNKNEDQSNKNNSSSSEKTTSENIN